MHSKTKTKPIGEEVFLQKQQERPEIFSLPPWNSELLLPIILTQNSNTLC